MNEMVLLIGVSVFAVSIGFLIFVLVFLRRISRDLKEFLRSTEENLNPALTELRLTLESIRRITDDVGSVTSEVRDLSDTVSDFSRTVRHAYSLVDDIGQNMRANISGLRAGLTAGILAFFTNLLSGKEK